MNEFSNIRSLYEQFGAKTVRRIRALQKDISSFPLRDGAGWFYAMELIKSLEAGLFLASIHLTASLLELFVRDLLIYNSVKNDVRSREQLLDYYEKHFENSKNPQWSFSRIIEELQSRNILKRSDVLKINEFYRRVRIPILHGLTRRFVQNDKESAKHNEFDVLDNLFFGRQSRNHVIEEQIEAEALDLIKRAVSFIKRYGKHFQNINRS